MKIRVESENSEQLDGVMFVDTAPKQLIEEKSRASVPDKPNEDQSRRKINPFVPICGNTA